MNRFFNIALLMVVVILGACTDVIDVPVQTAQTRLVVEASLDWEKGTAGNEQSIRLSTSTPFFEPGGNLIVTGAAVRVTNDNDGTEFVFSDQNDGTYTTTTFVPVMGQSYTLEIIHDGETYTATETLNPVTEIIGLSQSRDDGFDQDVLEVRVTFVDPPEEGNNYLLKFQKVGDLLPTLEVGTDEFVNGNEIDWWFELQEDDDTDKMEAFAPGDEVIIEMYATSEAYNNYLEILINQLGGVGLFEATPVAVRGNCVNTTNPENYAHGYFRLTEVVKTAYTFVE